MSITRAKQVLLSGEGIRVEYKEAQNELPQNLFESICAMLNREGGDIILGANDQGAVTGVDPAHVERLKTNIVNQSNNAEKLDPPYILFPQIHEIEGETVIHIQIPASSQLHKSRGIVYDRSNDGDFRVTQPHLIAELYNRKRTHYTEGTIYQHITMQDFNPELFPRIRNLIKSNDPNHPWLALDDTQLLKKAGLWRMDFQTGQEGYTLAAVLLLGKDEVIQQVLPHYKIDALVRKHDLQRYDDRLYIQTNLIDAYTELMDFVAKHLPDKFYASGEQRRSLRTAIFREIVANLIVHREYTNAHPATFIIYSDRVETENANNPNGSGVLSLEDFSPFPKNPLIAKFFIQLGRVEELGSGIINVNRFIVDYSGKDSPQFIEGNTFRMIIPVPDTPRDTNIDRVAGRNNEGVIEGVIEGVTEGVTEGVKERLIKIIAYLYSHPRAKVSDLQNHFDVSERTIKGDLERLGDFIVYHGSKKTGGYELTDGLKQLLKQV